MKKPKIRYMRWDSYFVEPGEVRPPNPERDELIARLQYEQLRRLGKLSPKPRETGS
jgi:hypothetical protein